MTDVQDKWHVWHINIASLFKPKSKTQNRVIFTEQKYLYSIYFAQKKFLSLYQLHLSIVSVL